MNNNLSTLLALALLIVMSVVGFVLVWSSAPPSAARHSTSDADSSELSAVHDALAVWRALHAPAGPLTAAQHATRGAHRIAAAEALADAVTDLPVDALGALLVDAREDEVAILLEGLARHPAPEALVLIGSVYDSEGASAALRQRAMGALIGQAEAGVQARR